jgi:hypothetical protein
MPSSTTPPLPRLPRNFFLPYPELAEQGPHTGPWKIENSLEQTWLPTNGATNKVSKRLWVPLEPGGEGVTLHELAHVRFSPEKFPRVRHPLIFLQATEDARINLGLEALGLPVELDREQLAHVAHLTARDVKSGDLAATIVRAIASLGTSAAPMVRAELAALRPRSAELAVGWVDRAEARLVNARARFGGPVAPFKLAREIAKDLARDLDRRGLVKDTFSVAGLGCCQVGDEGGLHGRGMSKSRYARMLERRRGEAGGVAVGRMKISRPPLSERQPSVLRAGMARRRCATEGARISRPDRYALDRAIFHRSGVGGGGTILVDTSGSMSLSAEHVEKLVRAAGGAAVVAIYSGKADEGELRIVARADWRVSSEFFEPFGGGNIVDLPALEWLARQPRPRVWVSDGGVTGVGDEGCAEILSACEELVARADVTRVETPGEAIELLEAASR